MAINGTFPLGQMPLLPIRQAPTTQTQVSGAPGIANRTITTPQDGLALTFQPGSIAVTINPSMMGPEDLIQALNDAGVAATLGRFAKLILPNATSVSGNATLKTALGLA